MSDVPLHITLQVQKDLARQGVEMTIEEINEVRKSAYANLRRELRAVGIDDVPDGDYEFLKWMKRVKRPGGGGKGGE
jgi:hypothetical protein